MTTGNDPDFLHKEYPKQFARDKFWAQIKRTVNGQPVTEREIGMIVSQIKQHLKLSPRSHLLDLGCGNGALAARLFPDLDQYTGVDFSPYLLGIAREYFQPNPGVRYLEADARTFVAHHPPDPTVDRVLLYGCLSYFSREDVGQLLDNLHQRWPATSIIFIGNVPDSRSAPEFFAARKVDRYELDNPQTPIGVWWTPTALISAAASAGFKAECLKMPADFYGHAYRFDIVLSRAA